MNNELDRVFYRETVRDSGVGEKKVIRRLSNIGVYAHVRVAVDALSRGRGNVFSWNAGMNIPARFAPAVAAGVQEAMDVGVLAGFQVTDVHVSIEDGSYHEEDSTSDAFRQATEQAVAQALLQAQPLLLESVSSVTVTVPDEYADMVRATVTSLGGEELRAEAGRTIIPIRISTSHVDSLMSRLLEIAGDQVKFSIESAGFRPATDPPDTVERWVARR